MKRRCVQYKTITRKVSYLHQKNRALIPFSGFFCSGGKMLNMNMDKFKMKIIYNIYIYIKYFCI